MKYVDRECTQCERMLMRARAMLTRCEYARWQVERLQECDKQILALDVARTDYERLKTRYAQARDLHRALRLKLRRKYYAELRELGSAASDVVGIEAKVEEYLRAGAEDPELARTLAAVHEAQVTTHERAGDYCEAHNELHRVIEESRHQAQALEALAMKMLPRAADNVRRLFGDEDTRPDASQATPLARLLRK